MIFTNFYIGVVALWKYLWSDRKPTRPEPTTIININLKTEPSEDEKPMMVEYDYNQYE